jgi:hypothetical protein
MRLIVAVPPVAVHDYKGKYSVSNNPMGQAVTSDAVNPMERRTVPAPSPKLYPPLVGSVTHSSDKANSSESYAKWS